MWYEFCFSNQVNVQKPQKAKVNIVNSTLKISLFVAIFSICLITYLLLPSCSALFGQTQMPLDIFGNSAADFVFFRVFAIP